MSIFTSESFINWVKTLPYAEELLFLSSKPTPAHKPAQPETVYPKIHDEWR